MNLTTRTFELMYCLAITFTIVALLGCGSGSNSAETVSADRSATITFQLKIGRPPNDAQNIPVNQAIGEPDICNDYLIDTIGVQIYRAQDDSELASSEVDCAEHSITISNVPEAETLYLVCKGYVGGNPVWQGRVDDIVTVAGQNTDLGIIDLNYSGDNVAAPEVVSTFPAPNAANVDLNASIVVVFNEKLAPSSIPDQAITVLHGDIPVSGQVDYDPGSSSIRFLPANALDAETTYTATLQSQSDGSGTITDTANNPFSGDVRWQFSTRGTNDGTAPQVIVTSPPNGATDAALQAAISAVFSEPMDPDSLTDGAFQLSSDQGAVSGQIAYDDQSRTLTMTPDSALDADTLYTAVITTQARDMAQNPLSKAYAWQFRSMDPSPSPANPPTAAISSPSGTYFKEGENIVFNATATDPEDGQLTGSALVWTSSINGQIGTGETLITSALSAGKHDITLTATDSTGATNTDHLSTITVAQTRFIKMDASTTGVPDAFNAFDGDEDTAATITAPDTEFICFKAYLGGVDTFIFKMKLGASTSRSKAALEGLTTGGVWQAVSEYGLGTDQTVRVTISDAQNYVDPEGYINLRVLWESGAAGDNAPVYEIWRTDPPYAGPQTTDVDNAELAFDNDPSTAATILLPFGFGGGSLLHFKAFMGTAIADRFTFEIQLNSIGQLQYLSFDVENLATSAWETITSLELNTTAARTVSIPITSDYLDDDGYVSLRARWENGSSNPPASIVNVYDIQRVDSFYLDSGRTSFGLIQDAENAVDQDKDNFAIMHNYWGEQGHYDTLNALVYLGDAAAFTFSIKTAQSLEGDGFTSELIVEGENSPNAWSEIQRIPLIQDTPATDVFELPDARQYVNADGWLSLRVRWEDHSVTILPQENGYIYEIWPGID